jgi:hypothetical protein
LRRSNLSGKVTFFVALRAGNVSFVVGSFANVMRCIVRSNRVDDAECRNAYTKWFDRLTTSGEVVQRVRNVVSIETRVLIEN